MSSMIMVRVQPECHGDAPGIVAVNDLAFGGTAESTLIRTIRRNGHATISLVAVVEDEIVGHILFTPVTIDLPGPPLAAMGLGPMAVLPTWQRRGIGSKLVQAGIDECRRRDCAVLVVLGHAEYYPRFGFRRADALGLRCEFDVPSEVFMAQELVEGALAGRSGTVRYLREFGST